MQEIFFLWCWCCCCYFCYLSKTEENKARRRKSVWFVCKRSCALSVTVVVQNAAVASFRSRCPHQETAKPICEWEWVTAADNGNRLLVFAVVSDCGALSQLWFDNGDGCELSVLVWRYRLVWRFSLAKYFSVWYNWAFGWIFRFLVYCFYRWGECSFIIYLHQAGLHSPKLEISWKIKYNLNYISDVEICVARIRF